MINLICSLDKNNGIGKNNELLVKIPEDLKRFKKLTINHPIIMGRKTYESLPGILPGRVHFILTSDPRSLACDNIHMYNDLQLMLEDAKKLDQNIFIIGGSSLFTQTIAYADRLYLTYIDEVYEADTFFPDFDGFDLVKESETLFYNDVRYTFKDFHKVKS